MSVTAMAIAWMRHAGSPGAKLVLMALADHANDDGVCWPGQETIARKAEMSTRAVRTNIAKLVELGIVRVEERRRADGSKASNLYVLDMTLGGPKPSAVSSGGLPEVSSSSHRKPASGHEPSVEPSASSPKEKKSRILKPEEEPVGFAEWLGHHVITGEKFGLALSVPKSMTSYRSGLARTFKALQEEGYSQDEFKLASEGVLADDYMREGGWVKPENVLRKEKIGGRISDGRRWRAQAEKGGKYDHLDG